MLVDLFKKMPQLQATDLHLSPGLKPAFRIHDVVQRSALETYTSEQIFEMVQVILTPEQKKKFEDEWELDFCYHLEGVGRFRSNFLKSRLGYGFISRYLPEKIPTPQEIGLSETIMKLTHNHQGLVLVTGPIRSGKTTTIASMIQSINTHESDHIITIEDPIEYVFPTGSALVNQRDINLHTHDTAAAMRAALREDPDIIFVGEMRDLETMHLAIEAAETGHLVFSTLQTKSAHKTIDRILDSFPPKQVSQIQTLLAGSLKGIVSQQLVKKADGKGMVLATEVLLNNPSLANMIREGKTFQIPSVMQIGRAHGMITMEESLLQLCKQGVVTINDAALKAPDPKMFRAKYGAKSDEPVKAAPAAVKEPK
jgi:twitching motility protein PilT